MIDELKRFVLVAKEGNLTKTAEKIFITQSALSQSIQRLEKALDTKLLIQKGRYLHLTPDGVAVLQLGSKILELWENAKNPQMRRSPLPTLTIGAYDNAALRLGSYFQKNVNSNQFRLELVIDNSGRLFSQLRLGILDVAICVIDKKYPPAKGLVLLKTFQEDLVPVSSKKFSGPIDKIPFILYNRGSNTREQINALFAEKNINPEIFAESTSVTFMKELAVLGGGIALLPENFVRNSIKQKLLKMQKLPIKFKREYGLYIQENGKLGKDHEVIKEIIKTLNQKSPAKTSTH